MAVPARPASGAPVASDWGGVVHDTIVAQDIQSGQAVVTTSGGVGGSAVVTFPRPFASTPIVVVTPQGNYTDSIKFVSILARSATSVTIALAAVTNFGWTVYWVAYGPRA